MIQKYFLIKRAKALYEFIDAENLDEIVKEARRED